MSEELVTVAAFDNEVAADLARNRLEDAGLSSFLADYETVGMVWQLSNALGGIKLQVRPEDAEEARSILDTRRLGTPTDMPGHDGETSTQGEADPHAGPVDQKEDFSEQAEEEERPTTERERRVDRAFRGAIFGLLFMPLQFYVPFLLAGALFSEGDLDPPHRRRLVIAAFINLSILLTFGLVVLVFSRL